MNWDAAIPEQTKCWPNCDKERLEKSAKLQLLIKELLIRELKMIPNKEDEADRQLFAANYDKERLGKMPICSC